MPADSELQQDSGNQTTATEGDPTLLPNTPGLFTPAAGDCDYLESVFLHSNDFSFALDNNLVGYPSLSTCDPPASISGVMPYLDFSLLAQDPGPAGSAETIRRSPPLDEKFTTKPASKRRGLEIEVFGTASPVMQ